MPPTVCMWNDLLWSAFPRLNFHIGYVAVGFQGSTSSIGTEAWQEGAVDIQVYDSSKLNLFKIERQNPRYFNEKEQVVRIT